MLQDREEHDHSPGKRHVMRDERERGSKPQLAPLSVTATGDDAPQRKVYREGQPSGGMTYPTAGKTHASGEKRREHEGRGNARLRANEAHRIYSRRGGRNEASRSTQKRGSQRSEQQRSEEGGTRRRAKKQGPETRRRGSEQSKSKQGQLAEANRAAGRKCATQSAERAEREHAVEY